jgi:hypothetical protein
MKLRFVPAALTWIVSVSAPCLLPAATLSLDPADGRVFGPPGTTVSWGFTITNDSGYVVPISLLYVDPVQIGTQTPIYFDFQVLTPDAPDNTLEGTFYFMIDPFAPAGANSLGGYLSLLYDRYSSADLGEQIGFSEEATADASVWVTPEPAVWKLMGLGAVFIGLMRLAGSKSRSWRRTRRNSM